MFKSVSQTMLGLEAAVHPAQRAGPKKHMEINLSTLRKVVPQSLGFMLDIYSYIT